MGDESGFVEQEPLTEAEARGAWHVVLASGFDLVGSFVILTTAFKYAVLDNGVSLYSLGFQAVSHWVSSLLLFLRFASEMKSQQSAEQHLLRARRRKLLYREQCLSISMALTMLISSCALLFKAFRKIKFWERWYVDLQRLKMDTEVMEATAWLAWVGFVIYTLQAILRTVAACKLRSEILQHGCVASFVSLIFLLVLGIAAKNEKEWSWKAEPVAAICLVVVTIAEGVRITYNYIDDMDARLRSDPRA